MNKGLQLVFAVVLGAGMIAPAFATSAADRSGDTQPGDQRFEQRLSGEVHHELAMIPEVTIFDNLSYRVDGGTVILSGQVRDAFIKSEAQSRVKHLEGVQSVNNQIEVLPASFNDDRVRRQVARAVFGDARLSMYSIQNVPPIRSIVKNGHVDLEGVVRTQTDKDTAFIRANGVNGVFSVDNNLQVEQPRKS
jgi:hyperosmotically inducible periplasmic protein